MKIRRKLLLLFRFLDKVVCKIYYMFIWFWFGIGLFLLNDEIVRYVFVYI